MLDHRPVTVMLTSLLLVPRSVSHQYFPLSVAGKASWMEQRDEHGWSWKTISFDQSHVMSEDSSSIKKKALHTSPSWVIFITLQRAASFGSSWYSQLTEKLSYLKNCSLLGETLTKTTRDHQNGGIHSVWIYIGKIGFQILVSLGNLTCSFSRIQKHHCTIKNKKLMEVNTT